MMTPEILGQDAAVARLCRMLAGGKVPSALLFWGPEGVGKRLTARLFAAALNCLKREENLPLPAGDGTSRVRRTGEGPYPVMTAPHPNPLPKERGLPLCGDCDSCKAILHRRHPDVTEADEAFQAALRDEDVERQRSIRVDTVRELTRRASRKAVGGVWSEAKTSTSVPGPALQSVKEAGPADAGAQRSGASAGRWKVFIIDNAQNLEPEASSALLKGLEEPEPDTVWVLVTSRRERILPTVASRCQAVGFRPLAQDVLRRVSEREGLLDPAALARWAGPAEGSLARARRLASFGALVDEGRRDPAGYWAVSQGLPRELAQARETAEGLLDALVAEAAADFRTRPSPERSRTLAGLLRLKRVLRQNASPQLIVQLALLGTEDSPSPFGRRWPKAG